MGVELSCRTSKGSVSLFGVHTLGVSEFNTVCLTKFARVSLELLYGSSDLYHGLVRAVCFQPV